MIKVVFEDHSMIIIDAEEIEVNTHGDLLLRKATYQSSRFVVTTVAAGRWTAAEQIKEMS